MSPSDAPGRAPRLMYLVVIVLLAAILVSQWTLHVLAAREAARTRRVLESIQTLLQKQDQSNAEVLSALDELQDLVEDVHGHLAPEQQ